MTYLTLEGHIFIQIPGGGTTRLEELMEDIAEHYSQVHLIKKNILFRVVKCTCTIKVLLSPPPLY